MRHDGQRRARDRETHRRWIKGLTDEQRERRRELHRERNRRYRANLSEEMRERYREHVRRYRAGLSEERRAELREYGCNYRANWTEAQKEHHRITEAQRYRQKIGREPRPLRWFTEAEDEVLRTIARTGQPWRVAARELGRNIHVVVTRATYIGARRRGDQPRH